MQVRLEKFEGPLSLLLQIIEKEELDITQISLSKIADEYLDYIKSSQNAINPEEMADFLVVAAKLLLIKSKALLPYLFPEEEEEIEEFEQQLKMYQEFVDMAKVIQKMLGKKKFMFTREFNRKAVLNNIKSFSPPKGIGAPDLAAIFSELISRLRPPEKLAERTIERKVSIEEKIIQIQTSLMDKIKISFNRLLADSGSRTEAVVSFLAMLELIKQRMIVVEQTDIFAEITICRCEEIDSSADFGIRAQKAE